MKKILLLISICTFFISCLTENKNNDFKKRTILIIANNQSIDTIFLESTEENIKDAFLILDTLQLGYYNPKPLDLCFGQPNKIIIDTSDYGEISDTTIGGFYMDTHDYTIYEYDEFGRIKEYRYEASVRNDLYHQTNYFYSNEKLDSISTINQADNYREIIDGKEGELKNDGIYGIRLHYTSNNEISSLKIHDLKRKKITLYNTVYSK